MSIKVFKPQLKSDKLQNYNNKTTACLIIFLSIITFLIFYHVEHIGMLACICITVFMTLLYCWIFAQEKKQLEKWDYGGYTTMEINTDTARIRFDNSVKLFVNQINYVEVIEDKKPSFLFGSRTYYSIVNVIMKFYLTDNTTIDFQVHNATKLIEIINMLRNLGINVLESEVEDKHRDDIKTFWVSMAMIAATVIFIIVAAIYNN